MLPPLTTTAYFPPLRWLAAALRGGGQWELEAEETYQKSGYRGRCRIAGANGPLLLSVPLEGGKHNGRPIRELQISERTDWRREHWQSIRSAYGRAPFWEFYSDEVEALLFAEHRHLWELNRALLSGLIELGRWPVRLSSTTAYEREVTDRLDLRPRRATEEVLPPLRPYPQLFRERHGFIENLSVLDGLLCLGPELVTHLMRS
ncbi:MAG: WbqC family protein [Saprospiraceae bacterium]